MDDNSETMEYAINNIPEEVKDYIFGFRFSKAFNALCEEKGFSEKEKTDFEIKLYEYLAQTTTEESLVETIHSISKTPEMNQSIINWIKEKVTDPVFSLAVDAAVREEEAEEALQEAGVVPAPSPLQALEGIKARLAQNTAVTPSARDYSVEKIQTSAPTEKPAIDPYREAPIE